MSYIFKKGATSQSIEVYIIDSTDGTPETGVVFNSAGIDLKYRRKDAVVVSITEADLTSPALTDTWESGGFLEIGNGVYRLDLPDAAIASAAGIDRVVVFGTVTGMVVLPVTIHLTDFDLNSATPDVNTKTLTAGAIANASFNADVGSTAHGTNIIALAVRKILEELNLDHLLKVVTAAADMTTEVTDNTILSRMLANGDTSVFDPSTDGLQPIRDRGDSAWITAAAGLNVNMTQISGDSTAADNLELQYDGTGLVGDPYPLRQDQGASIAGGLAVHTTMASVTVILGSEQDLGNAAISNDSRWTGDDDGSGAEFIFRCTPTDTSDNPADLHFEGYYNEPTGSTNSATLQVYNFDAGSWNTGEVFGNASVDEIHDIALSHGHKAPGSGTLESVAYTIGDVLIKFKQDTTETGNAVLLIDYMTVGFVGSLITAADIQAELEENSASLLDTIRDELANGSDGLTALKSAIDGLNDISTAQVNTEVDNALNTAIPGGPTSDSINQRVKAIDDLIQASGSGDLAAIKTLLDDMLVLDTTISSVTTPDTVFVLNAGLTGDVDMDDAICSIYDVTGGKWSGPRRVTDYTHSSLTLTINTNTAFPLAASDRVLIWNTSLATTTASSAITSGDIADIADQVWDEAQADHRTEGSTGEKQSRSDRIGR